MNAILLLRERLILSETAFVEVVVWRVPEPVRGSLHDFKYRLAYVRSGICLLRYDNEAGKGDHR
ncbi:MAG: toxin-antitoxin system TumE family protein, partial [Bosea sp. (in: a-proteobacteria)]